VQKSMRLDSPPPVWPSSFCSPSKVEREKGERDDHSTKIPSTDRNRIGSVLDHEVFGL
jgi:hypothetical protein